ncbi:alpha/beta fold hydrolase [Providencia rettgeri]|uniref:alpha/beta fold hydrolase n=1 Tax=Providencia rettgeri TaxID=587 RepID=UPI0034E0750A
MTKQVSQTSKLDAVLLDQYRAVLDQWPVPADHLWVDTREGDTFVVACGPRDAPPLVLLHGALTNSAIWMFDAERWSQSFRVYAVDVVGEPGLSSARQPSVSGGGYAAWLDDVLNGLKLKSTTFVGVSFGGWIALDYAVRRAHRVDRLALLCPAGIGRQKPFFLKALPFLLLGSWGKSRVRAMVMGPPPQGLQGPAQSLMEFISNIHAKVRPKPTRIRRFSDEDLRRLEMPVLIIIGGRDALIDSGETKRRVGSTMPGAQLHYLEDGFHYLPNQRETVFNFLQEKKIGCIL